MSAVPRKTSVIAHEAEDPHLQPPAVASVPETLNQGQGLCDETRGQRSPRHCTGIHRNAGLFLKALVLAVSLLLWGRDGSHLGQVFRVQHTTVDCAPGHHGQPCTQRVQLDPHTHCVLMITSLQD